MLRSKVFWGPGNCSFTWSVTSVLKCGVPLHDASTSLIVFWTFKPFASIYLYQQDEWALPGNCHSQKRFPVPNTAPPSLSRSFVLQRVEMVNSVDMVASPLTVLRQGPPSGSLLCRDCQTRRRPPKKNRRSFVIGKMATLAQDVQQLFPLLNKCSAPRTAPADRVTVLINP